MDAKVLQPKLRDISLSAFGAKAKVETVLKKLCPLPGSFDGLAAEIAMKALAEHIDKICKLEAEVIAR